MQIHLPLDFHFVTFVNNDLEDIENHWNYITGYINNGDTYKSLFERYLTGLEIYGIILDNIRTDISNYQGGIHSITNGGVYTVILNKGSIYYFSGLIFSYNAANIIYFNYLNGTINIKRYV